MPNDNIIDNLSMQINGDSSKAFASLDRVLNQLSALSNALERVNQNKLSLGFKKPTVDALRELGEVIDGLNLDKFKEFGTATAYINKIDLGLQKDTGENLSMFAMALEDIDVEKLWDFGSATQSFSKIDTGITATTGVNLSEFATALQKIDMEKLRQFADAGYFMPKMDMGITSGKAESLAMFAMSVSELEVGKLERLSKIDFSNLKPLTDSGRVLQGFTEQLKRVEAATRRAEKAQTALAKSTASTNREVKTSHHTFSLANTALGRFWNSIKRIAFYRAIRSALKSITQGFAEGIENLYYWSQAWDTSFAPKMDQLATAQLYLKNGFASMWSPLIEYAIPIIDTVIDRMVDMFNVVQELFAKLTGAATWNKAVKYPVTYKDALDDAAGSAKALNNILMDFDEINAINTPKSGSRGSAGDEKDYSKMFELVQTNVSSSPFGRLGTFFEDIAGKVEYAIGTVKQFAGFFKGLNFDPMQESAGRFWDTVSPILDELNEDARWLEEKVLEPITQFLVEKGIPTALDTLSVAIQNIWKFFKPLRDGLKSFWDQNGTWIMNILEEHTLLAFEKIQDLFKAIGNFATKNGTKIRGIFSSLSNTAERLSPIITAISKVIGTHAWETFVQSITDIFTALEPILTLLDGIFTIIDGIVNWDSGKVMSGIGRVGESVLQALLAPLKMVLNAFATLIDTLAVLVEKVDKDAAREMRDFANILRGTDEQTQALNDAMAGLNATWWEMDEVSNVFHNNLNARGEMVDFINKINDADSSMNVSVDTIERLVGSIQQVGPKSQSEFQLLQYWTDWCTKYGVNPLRTSIGYASKDIDGIGGVSKTAAKELTNQFASALSPTAGFNFGKTFGDNIQKGMNPSGIGWNLGAQMAANAQAALNMSPLQLKATINATINSVNANDKWRAALASAGVSTAGFASGGFPTPSTMFYAGERGVPEMLGTIGGRTAVAGGEEITGIREAVYESGQRQETLLRSLISAVNSKDLTLVANSATGRWVNKALKSYAGVTG